MKNTYFVNEILAKEENYVSFRFIFVFWYIFVIVLLSKNGVHCSYLVLFKPLLMSFLTLFAIAELIHWFLHCLVTTTVKAYFWENVRSRKCRRGKCPSGKCTVGEVSIEELSFKEVPVEELSEYQFTS